MYYEKENLKNLQEENHNSFRKQKLGTFSAYLNINISMWVKKATMSPTLISVT